MAGCKTFNITVSGDIAALLEKARSQTIEPGVSFEGDMRSGTFFGKSSIMGAVEGKYEISGYEVTIKITSKPFFVSCKVLESKIRDYFRQAEADEELST
jgi:hypothetical protein